jgi:hypothetical protein
MKIEINTLVLAMIDIINTHMHDRLLSVLNTGTSMHNGGIKLV